jgi:predicted DNA-binding transcriptional regulator AlpA
MTFTAGYRRNPLETQPISVDIKEASRLTGLSVSWFRKRILNRTIPFTTPLGTRKILFLVSDLQVMMQAGRQVI